MRGCIFAIFLAVGGLMTPLALADVQTGKVLMVVENHLAVIGPANEEVVRFDISEAAIYRNGLPVPPAGLVSGDWVTVTTEIQDGRKVATLVEAGGDHHPAATVD